jgi:hypothetical protein
MSVIDDRGHDMSDDFTLTWMDPHGLPPLFPSYSPPHLEPLFCFDASPPDTVAHCGYRRLADIEDGERQTCIVFEGAIVTLADLGVDVVASRGRCFVSRPVCSGCAQYRELVLGLVEPGCGRTSRASSLPTPSLSRSTMNAASGDAGPPTGLEAAPNEAEKLAQTKWHAG